MKFKNLIVPVLTMTLLSQSIVLGDVVNFKKVINNDKVVYNDYDWNDDWCDDDYDWDDDWCDNDYDWDNNWYDNYNGYGSYNYKDSYYNIPRNTIIKDITIDKKDASKITNIDIEWIKGEVKILKSDNDNIRLVEKAVSQLSDNIKFTDIIENDKLKIVDNNDWGAVSFIGNAIYLIDNNGHSRTKVTKEEYEKRLKESILDLEIYLPERQYSLLKFKSDRGGSLSLKDFNITDLDLNSLSGALNFDNCIISNLSSETVNGAINLANSKIKDLKSETVNGSISVTENTVVSGKFDLSAVNGMIDVYYNELPKNLKASVVNGMIKLSIPENDGFYIKNNSSNKWISSGFDSDFDIENTKTKYIYKNGATKLDLSCVNGSIGVYRLK